MENQEVATTTQAAEAQQQVAAPNPNSMVEFLLNDGNVQKPQEQTTVQQQQTQAAELIKEEEEILDQKEWLRREFEVEDPELLKQQIKEYHELKSKPKEEISFANEDSKKAYEYLLEGKEEELYNFLNQKKQIEKLLQDEITDSTAADIVKFAMQQKYKDLTKEQIDYKFNKQFSVPKAPVQGDTELDDEFAARKQEWQERVNEIKMDLEIEARLAKPEIEKLKLELVLPDIKKESSGSQQLSQEDLAAIKETQETFLKQSQSFINDFTGFAVNVKDKDVDYSVGYNLDAEEKKLLNEKINEFTVDNFNANAIFAERWLSADGKSINTEQMVKDLSRVFVAEKFEQKLALDAANKRIEEYLKQKKNINLETTTVSGQFNPDNEKTAADKLRDAILAV